MELSHETWIQLEACFSLQLDLCKKVAPNKEVQHWWVPLAVVGARPRQPGKGLKGAVTSAISEMSRISLLELTLEIQYFSAEIQ